jgi:hypothetical protein
VALPHSPPEIKLLKTNLASINNIASITQVEQDDKYNDQSIHTETEPSVASTSKKAAIIEDDNDYDHFLDTDTRQ